MGMTYKQAARILRWLEEEIEEATVNTHMAILMGARALEREQAEYLLNRRVVEEAIESTKWDRVNDEIMLDYEELVGRVNDIEPVHPKKIGAWIDQRDYTKPHYGWMQCISCGEYAEKATAYCPYCGSWNEEDNNGE